MFSAMSTTENEVRVSNGLVTKVRKGNLKLEG